MTSEPQKTPDESYQPLARTFLVRRLELAPEKEFLIRSLAGHIVAGVASEEEVRAFEKFCSSLA